MGVRAGGGLIGASHHPPEFGPENSFGAEAKICAEPHFRKNNLKNIINHC